jgi:hypothetical protein
MAQFLLQEINPADQFFSRKDLVSERRKRKQTPAHPGKTGGC